MALAEFVQQEGVDVIAHAEGKETHILGGTRLDIAQNGGQIGDTCRRQPICQEQHDQRVLVIVHVERRAQRAVDIRISTREQRLQPLLGVLRLADRLNFGGIGRDPGVENQQVEAILRVEVIQHELRGSAGLFPLFALHRAGAVQHHDHVLRDHPLGFDFDRRCDQRHEEAIVRRAFAVGEQVQVDFIAGQAVVQAEIVTFVRVARLVPHHKRLVALAVDGDGVGGRIDGADRIVRLHLHVDAETAHRQVRDMIDPQRIDVVDQPLIDFQQLGIFDFEGALAAGRDREDVGLDGVRADVFEQRRIAHLLHDGRVDLLSFFFFQNLGPVGLAVDAHHQIGDRHAARQRKHVGAFGVAPAFVGEHLLDAGARDLVHDLDAHPVRTDIDQAVRLLARHPGTRRRRGGRRQGGEDAHAGHDHGEDQDGGPKQSAVFHR